MNTKMQFLELSLLKLEQKNKLIHFANEIPSLAMEVDKLLATRGLNGFSVAQLVLTEDDSQKLATRSVEASPVGAGIAQSGLLFGGDLVNNG